MRLVNRAGRCPGFARPQGVRHRRRRLVAHEPGSLATIARQAPPNLVLIVWDNHQWAETGGQPTHTATGTDLAGIARASGIREVASVDTLEAFEEALDRSISADGPWCIVADIDERGHGPRPSVNADENFLSFRRALAG